MAYPRGNPKTSISRTAVLVPFFRLVIDNCLGFGSWDLGVCLLPSTMTLNCTRIGGLTIWQITLVIPDGPGKLSPPIRNPRMCLASLLSAEQIIPEMTATERWSAIVELIDLLVRLGKIRTEDRESILASLKQREETMSTGIGFGIAIPHASSDRIEEVVASFG